MIFFSTIRIELLYFPIALSQSFCPCEDGPVTSHACRVDFKFIYCVSYCVEIEDNE
ncbi:hypothetical protein GcM3_c11683o22 [Golovinomyces cichoracearum]|uniref:Uncharacterized protein n=1 Tax=Golovinomyces cichoracearum TaxID=62708 RepID=A0A420J9C3_9PEZI|nr:hypothetical protein GcM3_c11683o22 [Golovinomyces cichoracearum]